MTNEDQENITANLHAAAFLLASATVEANKVLFGGQDDLERVRSEFNRHVSCAAAHFEAAIDRRIVAGKTE